MFSTRKMLFCGEKFFEKKKKGLAGAVSCLQEDIDRAERGEEEMIMLREALEEKENALLKLRAMEGQGELISHKMLEIEAQKQDINEQLMELKQSKLVEIPVIKHALGLYANITNLRWDYDAKTVKGYIAKTDDVKHFDIKDSENSVRVADQLWGMM
jgi:hypothetical protein